MDKYGLHTVQDDSGTFHAKVGKKKGLQITLDQVTNLPKMFCDYWISQTLFPQL